MSGPIRTQAYHADQVFKEARLERAQLLSSEFYDCAFVRCSFVESVFRNCRFVNCAFQQCDLSLVQVAGSTFSSTRFEDSKVIGVDWTQARLAGTRDPYLRKRVPRERMATFWAAASDGKSLRRALDDFGARLAGGSPAPAAKRPARVSEVEEV